MDKYLIQCRDRGAVKFLVKPIPAGAKALPTYFTKDKAAAWKFPHSNARTEAGKLQRQGFRTCVIPA